MDFCLPIDSVEAVLPAWRGADTADIVLLRDAASRVFRRVGFAHPSITLQTAGVFMRNGWKTRYVAPLTMFA